MWQSDADASVQDGWLDVTHTLTFAGALRVALRRWRHPDAHRLLLYAVRFANHAHPLDLPAEARLSLAPRDPGAGGVAAITAAIAEKRAQDAVSLTAGYLATGHPINPLRNALEDLAVGDGLTRPIVVAHAIKTSVAAFDEYAAMCERWRNGRCSRRCACCRPPFASAAWAAPCTTPFASWCTARFRVH